VWTRQEFPCGLASRELQLDSFCRSSRALKTSAAVSQMRARSPRHATSAQARCGITLLGVLWGNSHSSRPTWSTAPARMNFPTAQATKNDSASQPTRKIRIVSSIFAPHVLPSAGEGCIRSARPSFSTASRQALEVVGSLRAEPTKFNRVLSVPGVVNLSSHSPPLHNLTLSQFSGMQKSGSRLSWALCPGLTQGFKCAFAWL